MIRHHRLDTSHRIRYNQCEIVQPMIGDEINQHAFLAEIENEISIQQSSHTLAVKINCRNFTTPFHSNICINIFIQNLNSPFRVFTFYSTQLMILNTETISKHYKLHANEVMREFFIRLVNEKHNSINREDNFRLSQLD